MPTGMGRTRDDYDPVHAVERDSFVTRLLGAVLAGGQARRFGSDKALALLDGKALIVHAIDRLAVQVERVVICGRAQDDGTGLSDRPVAGLGPLGGLCAALYHGADNGFDAVVSVGCDTPLLPDDMVAQLMAAGAAAYVADLPIIGLWPTALAQRLEAHLAGDDRSMRGWARAVDARPVALASPIANINRAEDLIALGNKSP